MTDKEDPAVRHMVPDDLVAATSVLAACFLDDPFFIWLCPDEDLRSATVRSWMGFSVSRSLERGHSYVAVSDAGVVGAALWSPPGVDITTGLELRGQALAASAILDQSLDRYAALQPVSAMQPQMPHFYLRDVGVLPAVQGCGVGYRLLETTHATCDREGWPAYLETTRESSREFFESLGYVALGSVRVAAALNFTGMLRRPLTDCNRSARSTPEPSALVPQP